MEKRPANGIACIPRNFRGAGEAVCLPLPRTSTRIQAVAAYHSEMGTRGPPGGVQSESPHLVLLYSIFLEGPHKI